MANDVDTSGAAVDLEQQEHGYSERDMSEGKKFMENYRRYVGPKETIAYLIYDMSQSFNIGYDARFITSIVKMPLNYQTITGFINGIWDIVNDLFTGAIVDKTRTRFGKFKPYLLLLAIPGTIGTCLYWLMPVLFPGAGSAFRKFLFYLILAMAREGAGTFRGLAQGGLLATITPHPVDRTRLITFANFFSGLLGEKLPSQIMDVLLTLVEQNVFKWSLKKLFVTMGMATTIIAGAGAFWFFVVAKERVMQSVETPSIKQSILSVINNKPILLLTLSDLLGRIFTVSTGTGQSEYVIDVLHFPALPLITGIPGAIVHPISYAIVPWFRKRFSTRTLYMFGNYVGDIIMIPVFLIGMIGGKKNGIYKKIIPMGFALMIWEVIFMFFYGVRKVIPSEMYNESIDYCEWKNGYRSEAMISVAKGLAVKLAATFNGVLTTQLKRIIGYDLSAYVDRREQTDNVKFWIFASYTVLPLVSSVFSIIPIFFYDLGGAKRDKMYEELLTRRAELSREATSGDSEAIARVAKAQMMVNKSDKDLG